MDMSIRFPHLGLELDYVPHSINVFGFEITIFGILIAVGMLLGIAFVVLEAKRSNQNQNIYLDMLIFSILGAVVGARLYYVGCSWDLYKGNVTQILNLRSGGMAFYGGLFGAVLAAALFCRIRRLSFWQMADTASMGILIGQIIGRWGNFFNRESFGEYTDSALAMQLPLASVRSSEVTSLMRENLATVDGVSYIQVHPAFLYESLWCLLLLLLLLMCRRKKRFHGELFMRYLAGYGLGRFFIEWLRTDKLCFYGTRIPASLVLSAVLFVIFFITVTVKRIMAKKRAILRKRRRELVYEEEEKRMAELDKEEASPKASASGEAAGTEEEGIRIFPERADWQEPSGPAAPGSHYGPAAEWEPSGPAASGSHHESAAEQEQSGATAAWEHFGTAAERVPSGAASEPSGPAEPREMADEDDWHILEPYRDERNVGRTPSGEAWPENPETPEETGQPDPEPQGSAPGPEDEPQA